MHLPARFIVVVLLLVLTATGHGASDWTAVKPGITTVEAEAALGQPLIRTYGRGFEVWIYDGQGEIVFAGGPALGWTLPVLTAESAARPVENDVLIRPVRRLPVFRTLQPQNNLPVGSSDIRFRYKK